MTVCWGFSLITGSSDLDLTNCETVGCTSVESYDSEFVNKLTIQPTTTVTMLPKTL